MAEIKKALRLDTTNYYHTHLMIVNCILPEDSRMTPREIEILAAFMSLEGDLAIHRFGPTARKVVMAQLKISPAGLSNYVGSLSDKGFLIKMGDVTTIFPLLQPETGLQDYRLRLYNMGMPIDSDTSSDTIIINTDTNENSNDSSE